MAIFKNQIEDLAGAIPATADAQQFLADGVTDVVHRIKKLYPEHLPLFAKEESIADGGTALHDTDVLEVERANKTCRRINGSGRHAAIDATSINYSPVSDPVYYFLNEKIYVRPTGGSPTCSIVAHGSVSNWDSSNSGITYMPDENYFQVVMYAAMQVLHHKMVVFPMPTLSVTAVPPEVPIANIPTYVPPSIGGSSNSSDLSDMIDSTWDNLDFDFDNENIDFSTWFQAAGDMIQNQEDVELASIQLQKIAAYVNSYSVALQNRLNIFNTKIQDHTAAQGLYQAELGQYQQEVNAQVAEYTNNFGEANLAYQWLQGQLANVTQQYNQSFLVGGGPQ